MIGAGHCWADVRGYTLAQLEAFREAVDSEARESSRMALIITRAAQAKEKDYRKILKELS
ncbi:hypothetical protein PKB_1286 [Pseudomonas knackmussii B13]|uniref:Uncharacterized protein n=1 Tax=Pseudomonas knackmussii (strain DSM 6978 / CCUG 54928 / LMG 23759 / B13) TaxID=1301098 RepID=A0A024HCT3_PSEKB|nr:hypothetical protein PKB_1286 [Pseudomonas knackmussii B13]